jgi:pSer/pThr/pTyr-binding forkhead associated (FHA) protein
MQATRVQTGQQPKLFHVQTNTYIDLPPNLPVIYIGKPNDRIPPNIDVSCLPNSDVVSRVHASILVNGDNYSIEDLGSANGTYLNHSRLTALTNHQLHPGDRIDFGKDNKITFLFQRSSNTPNNNYKAENKEEEHVTFVSKLLGLVLMLGGLVFLAGSIVIGSPVWIYNSPLIALSIAGVFILTNGGLFRHLGWFLIGIGIVIAIGSGGIFILPIGLLPFLLAVSAFSVGYQLFTSGKVLSYNLLSIKEVFKKLTYK